MISQTNSHSHRKATGIEFTYINMFLTFERAQSLFKLTFHPIRLHSFLCLKVLSLKPCMIRLCFRPYAQRILHIHSHWLRSTMLRHVSKHLTIPLVDRCKHMCTDYVSLLTSCSTTSQGLRAALAACIHGSRYAPMIASIRSAPSLFPSVVKLIFCIFEK